jgi:hypothetical protein
MVLVGNKGNKSSRKMRPNCWRSVALAALSVYVAGLPAITSQYGGKSGGAAAVAQARLICLRSRRRRTESAREARFLRAHVAPTRRPSAVRRAPRRDATPGTRSGGRRQKAARSRGDRPRPSSGADEDLSDAGGSSS